MIGTLHLDCGFNYGMFGFGESYQVHNPHYKPEQFLHWSLFPRVTPPEEHTDAKGLLTIPREDLSTSLNIHFIKITLIITSYGSEEFSN